MDPSPLADPLQIAGLPLHPLIVHAVVILTPLTVLALLLGTFWPAARRRLGVVTPLAALIVLVLVPITVSAGESLETLVGRSPAVARHEELGRMLLPWAIGLFAVALVQWLWFGFGRRRVRTSLSRAAFGVDAAVAVSAVAVSAGTLVLLVLIGDAGARAVWGGLVGT